MILYFSGTGNSRHAARMMADFIGDELVSINSYIKSGRRETLRSYTPFVFVAPTHCWRMPGIVEEFIRQTQFEGSAKAYFVLTCGTGAGGAAAHCRALSDEKGFEFMGMSSILMPENYVAMFPVPGQAEAEAIIRKARPRILAVAERIKSVQPLPEENPGLIARLKSGPVNSLFSRLFISARRFYATDACTGCGKCQELCPTNNITLADDRPMWGNACVHCMACICACKQGAIECGRATQGKPRYYFDDTPADAEKNK